MNRMLKAILISFVVLGFFMGAGCSSSSNGPDVDDSDPSRPTASNPKPPASLPPPSGDYSTYTSVQFAAAMKCGWNLGNTFDANSTGDRNNQGLSTETSWGMPETTQAMINAVAAKGIKTIRIPVSWHNHIVEGTNFTIDSAWLARVKTVVDWALARDMFVIINIHHDNLTSSQMGSTYGFTVNTNSTEQAASMKYITKVWEQVASYFRNYDYRLVFELLNEPRDMDTTNNGFGSSDAEVSVRNPIIKAYEQSALNAVRSSGGKNANRFVMVPYYAASPWRSQGWSLPSDSANDKLLVSTHAYDPYAFAMGDMSVTQFTSSTANELTNLFSNCINSKWVSKGVGVVMGEGSCTDKNNLSDRMKWFEDYVSKAKSVSCPLILWDNMTTISTGGTDVAERHGYFNRRNLSWYFPTLVEKMVELSGSKPEADGISLISMAYDMNMEDWSIQCIIPREKFNAAGNSSYIKVTYEKSSGSPSYASLKLTTHWDAEENEISAAGNFSNGLSFSSEDSSIDLEVPSGTTSFTFTPTAVNWPVIKEKGLTIYGYGIKITSVKLY